MKAVSNVAQVKVAMIGAGAVNFGSCEGPWNHSARLQQLQHVLFSAVIDPDVSLARQRVATLAQGEHASKWQHTKVFPSYQAMLLCPDSKPDAAYIGVAANLHGSSHSPDVCMELDLAKAGISLFIEKPISSRPASEVVDLAQQLHAIQAHNGIKIAVGYMLRYSAVAQEAKRILSSHSSQALAINGRFAGAYSAINKEFWWDVSQSGGPIMQSATHFVDLMRFLGGDIVKGSISAVRVGPEATLCDLPEKSEQKVPMQQRINRVTAAIWRFANGAVGSLMHSAVLHNTKFSTELEIMADGLHLKLLDPYGKAQLLVRYPQSNDYQEILLQHDDMYMTETAAFVKAVQTGDSSTILTPYADAVCTYQATEWITAASYNDNMVLPATNQVTTPAKSSMPRFAHE